MKKVLLLLVSSLTILTASPVHAGTEWIERDPKVYTFDLGSLDRTYDMSPREGVFCQVSVYYAGVAFYAYRNYSGHGSTSEGAITKMGDASVLNYAEYEFSGGIKWRLRLASRSSSFAALCAESAKQLPPEVREKFRGVFGIE